MIRASFGFSELSKLEQFTIIYLFSFSGKKLVENLEFRNCALKRFLSVQLFLHACILISRNSIIVKVHEKMRLLKSEQASSSVWFSNTLIGSLIILGLLNAVSFDCADGALARRRWQNGINSGDDFEQVKLFRSQKAKRANVPAPAKPTNLQKPSESGGTASDELNSGKMDADTVNKLGTVGLKNKKPASVIDRKRRDHQAEQYHEHKAESDSIAAAANAALAEADSVAAAVEESEALQAGGDNSMVFEESDNGNDMVALEEDLREKEHGGHSGNEHLVHALKDGLMHPDYVKTHEGHHSGNDGHGHHGGHSGNDALMQAIHDGTLTEVEDDRENNGHGHAHHGHGHQEHYPEEKLTHPIHDGTLTEIEDDREMQHGGHSADDAFLRTIQDGTLAEVEDDRENHGHGHGHGQDHHGHSTGENHMHPVHDGALTEADLHENQAHGGHHGSHSADDNFMHAVNDGSLTETEHVRENNDHGHGGHSEEEKLREAIKDISLMETGEQQQEHRGQPEYQNFHDFHGMEDEYETDYPENVHESHFGNDNYEPGGLFYETEDEREKEHEGHSGVDRSSESRTIGEAPLHHVETADQEHEPGGHSDTFSISNDNVDEEDVDTFPLSTNMLSGVDAASSNLAHELNHPPDVQGPISQLLEESKDLAREIRLVFQVIAKREQYLVSEMEKLKRALANAIQDIQDNNAVSKLIRKKRYDYSANNDATAPYKACVYLTAPEKQVENNNFASAEQLIQQPPTLPPTPIYYPPVQQDNYISDNTYVPNDAGYNNDIDLSSVYWLKLPADGQQGVMDKVQRVITNLRTSGRDLLLIPVTNGFTSQEDLARGFLRAVRVGSASSQKGRKRKLRLRFRRI